MSKETMNDSVQPHELVRWQRLLEAAEALQGEQPAAGGVQHGVVTGAFEVEYVLEIHFHDFVLRFHEDKIRSFLLRNGQRGSYALLQLANGERKPLEGDGGFSR